MQGRRSAEHATQTRAQLLAVAKSLFGKKGYAATGTEEVVAVAKVTRGALYHHFKDKEALFDALVVDIAGEVLAAVEAAAAAKRTKLEGLIAGCEAYLDVCLAPAIRQIYVIDAPSVLGIARAREIDAMTARGSLEEGINDVIAETGVKGLSSNALTALLSGALDEAVLWLVRNPNAAARRQLDKMLAHLMHGIFR